MKKTILSLLLLALAPLPSGCILAIGSGSDSDPIARASQASELRSTNQSRLETLSIGMSVDQVMQRMGESSVWINKELGWVRNPYRSESFRSSNGSSLLVLYYYTHLRERDDIIADDELTPVGFEDGKLIGWGWSFFDREIRTM